MVPDADYEISNAVRAACRRSIGYERCECANDVAKVSVSGIGLLCFFFSSRRRHTRFKCDWSSDVCSSDLGGGVGRGDRFAVAAAEPISSADAAALKEAVNAARRGKTTQAEDLQKTISDPVARKLVEWAILRSAGTNSIDLRRYMAFINANPS